MRLGLRKFGFTVDTFNDPMQALKQFKPNYYQSIILDIRMPGMSGFELARQIWAKDPSAKICFFSAFEVYENEADKVFVGLKTHCFIKKPIMPSDLAKHIEAHLMPAI
jgi:DNA-binding response OmpR family regulator